MSGSSSRIVGQAEEISYEETRQFFQDRAARAPAVGLLSVTMYQDGNPRLAEARDAWEKERVLPLLRLQPSTRVLDIGCGCGRWALSLRGKVASYLGVDFSEQLLAIAESELRRQAGISDFVADGLATEDTEDTERGLEERSEQVRRTSGLISEPFPSSSSSVLSVSSVAKPGSEIGGFRFQKLAAGEIAAERLAVPPPFDLFLISGLMTYLNDGDCRNMLAQVGELAAEAAQVYIREPMAVTERLTLKGHFSPELAAEYHAIYRTRSEYLEMLTPTVLDRGFRISEDAELLGGELRNRKETHQRILLLERGRHA